MFVARSIIAQLRTSAIFPPKKFKRKKGRRVRNGVWSKFLFSHRINEAKQIILFIIHLNRAASRRVISGTPILSVRFLFYSAASNSRRQKWKTCAGRARVKNDHR